MAISEKAHFIFPCKFLDSLNKCLDNNGGLMIDSISTLVDLMKVSKEKLVPRCMALTIISMSPLDVQIKLCESGVWNILFQWLQDGLKHDTTCFIVDILKLYLKLPITFANLKSNACPKLIKKLSKSGNEEITPIAKDIYVKWKKLVEENTTKDVPSKKIKLDEKDDKHDVGEDKKKLTTVKVKNTKLRTAGLEDDSEIKPKKIETNEMKQKNEKGTVNIDELHQKIDKRKVIELHESKNFINSIMQSSAPPKKKIKKRQETQQPINKSGTDVSVEEVVSDTSSNNKEVSTEKPKKRVSWAPSESLQTIKYFELDENERVNVNRISIEEMRKKEKLMEKQNASRKFLNDDLEDETNTEKWYKPQQVMGFPAAKVEVSSIEKKLQQERERKVLKIFYFSKDDIPSTPTEPDNESYDVKEPKVIPFNDVTVVKQKQTANNTDNKVLIFTENEGSERQASLRPDVANLIKSMTQSGTSKPMNSEDNSKSECGDPLLKAKLINIIRSKYPDVEPEQLSIDELYKLLVPIKDQLIREGLMRDNVPIAQSNVSIPPPPTNFAHPVPPQWFNEQQRPPPPIFHPLPPNMPPNMPRPFPSRPPPPNRHYNHNGRPFNHNRGICRYFANTGFCRQGNNCSFSHNIPPDYQKSFNQNRH